jgi:hypothetical protein
MILRPASSLINVAMTLGVVGITATLLVATTAARAQQGDDLREAAQNPIADLISVPFQNDTNFDIGHTDNTQNILNIQPVYPTHLGPNWNLISRPILPVVYQPPFLSGAELRAAEQLFGPEIGETEFGLGDLTTEFFFSPRKPIRLGSDASLVWGLGPVFQFPTATDELLGTEKWSAGADFVVFLSDKRLHITTGFLILNLWSFAGDEDRANVNAMTFEPFLNYNLPKGCYLVTSPIITANWEADEDNRWTVPVGGGFGCIFKIGHQPINANLQAYYNAVTPDDVGANWQLRTTWTFLFPTH